MDTPDEHAATAARGLLGKRLSRRPEPRQWTHHVADLNSGEAYTTVLDQPPTSKSRIQGLSRLNSVLDTTIFGGPSQRLTTRTPYQASPEAWVEANIDYFNPRVGMQWLPPDHPEGLSSLSCYFSQLPAERSLLSISLEAAAVSATVGHVSVGWVPLDEGGPGAGLVRFPIQGPITDYTLDFTFERGGIDPPEFVMTLEPGIDWMLIRLGHAPDRATGRLPRPVLTPKRDRNSRPRTRPRSPVEDHRSNRHVCQGQRRRPEDLEVERSPRYRSGRAAEPHPSARRTSPADGRSGGRRCRPSPNRRAVRHQDRPGPLGG